MIRGDDARRLAGRAAIGFYRGVARSRSKFFSMAISGAFADWGAHSVAVTPLRLCGEHRISVGSDVYIGAGSWLEVPPEAEGTGVVMRIGDGTGIAGNCVLSAASSVVLGRSVLLARNVYVSDHIHAYGDETVPIQDQGIAKVLPVVIDDGAWLGQNVVVCPGVRVGKNAVVAANAVVTKDVPDGSLAAGVPARVVREARPRDRLAD